MQKSKNNDFLSNINTCMEILQKQVIDLMENVIFQIKHENSPQSYVQKQVKQQKKIT